MKTDTFASLIEDDILAKHLHSEWIAEETTARQSLRKKIAFGVDGQFVKYVFITIQSIIENSAGESFTFHVITDENTGDLIAKFRQLVSGSRHAIFLHHISPELFKDLPTTSLFSKATYYRLLAPHFIEDAEVLIYMDADIVCLADFSALWSTFSGTDKNIVAVVLEDASLRPSLAAAVGLKSNNYFNAGVMVINVAHWLNENISSKTFALLNQRGKEFRFLDQDALNLILEDQFRILETKYNTLFMLGHSQAEYQRLPPADTTFLHYAGADKPWQIWNEQQVCRYYLDVYQRSVWSGQPREMPQKDWQAKRMYKLMLRQKKIMPFVKWYLAYFVYRYLK
ncbi:MAG: General stress protein A [Candidatus Erwinia impunctatus]|nr:General stress protein A [Culicoides impunctatus]